MTWKVPLSDLDYGPEEDTAVLEVLRSKWLSMGPRTEAMEAEFAKYLGVKYAIAVSNCTAALELVLSEVLCPSLEPDGTSAPHSDASRTDRPLVIVPDLTFVATANTAYTCGARVCTADLAPGSPFPGPDQYREAVDRAGGSPPAALVVVHYGGFDAGVEKLIPLARHYGCPIIEDTAHAIGAQSTESHQPLGTLGLAGCYSFFANKNLSTGEGGLIATNNDDLARVLRLRRSHGMTSLTWQRHQGRANSYDVLTAGHNLRITEITAALALTQLGKLDSGNRRRRELWRRYSEAFAPVPSLSVPLGPLESGDQELERSACHIYPILARDQTHRDQIRAHLAALGIQTSHHYPAIHTFSFWSGALADSANGICHPRVESARFSDRELTLPLHPGLGEEDQDFVIGAVKECCP